ncbi:hypothetical protein NEMBOFW57_008729 [Staphylotrichum longicolle]|uniref:ABC transporter n=1 Tax=Staphylotrichum longicolle TaxID=669026 RepID=A0AAD4ESC0_9PEZI|nr:hypothetical protein NEMBOFW57_008729 [Staphylotrichum longicolle]
MAPKTVPQSASPSPPVKKESRPTLLKPQYKTAFGDFVRIFSFSTWLDKALLLAAVMTSIGAGVTMPVMNIIFGRMVGSFTGFFSADAATTYEMFKNAINTCALEYLKALFAQPVSTLDVLPPGQTAAIITITASTLQAGISEKLSAFLQSTSTVISAFIIAMCYSWSLTLITSSGLLLIVITYAATTPFLVKRLNEVQHADIQASTTANEIFSSIRMIAACGADEKMARRYATWVDESRRRGLKMSPIIAMQQAPVQFAVYSAETLIVVLMSVMLMTTSISGITAPLAAAARAAGAATIFYTIIDAPRPDKSGAKHPEVSASEDIVLDHVNFAYPTRPDLKILDSLCLRFPAGKVTAIVGPSGSGKSTIVGLLERWYEIESYESQHLSLRWRNGSITVGGRPLREIDLKWWRTQIGLVQQEPCLFNNTIYANVEFGLIGTEWQDADLETKKQLVKQACIEAFADEFISRLPDGYSTVVGDAGIKLSGGQRQRLAIARSIVKRPKILILDEATSSIDVRGEQMVQAALDKVSKNRTTIVIAHRLATVRKADNIIVLRKGKAVQQGTHDSLMTQEGGAYWALATAQQLTMEPEEDPKDSAQANDAEIAEKKSMATIATDTTLVETVAAPDVLWVAEHITHYYRGEYFRNILSKSVAFFDADDHSVGALTAQLATDPSQLQELLGTNMAFVIISVLNVVGCLAIAFYFGWKLTVVTLCSSMPLIIAAAFFRIRYETQFAKMNNEVFAESAKFATESIGAFRTVSALTLEDTITRRYETLLREHIKKAFWKSSWTTLIFATADNIAKASVAAGQIIDMRGKDQVDGKLISLDNGNIGENDMGVKIQFQNVWFRYPTRDVPILNGLNLTEPNLFDGTLRDNVLLGVDETTTTEDQLHQACRDAEIHDFIVSLPDGYNTEVGTRGVTLSGGQKQRLAIARALIRNPRLLLLDEATSNLDAETEKSVQAVFEKNKKNRTMVVVAHRLATVQNADIIFVLADGKVVERGDHTSLLSRRGIYYQMCQSQALDR